MEAAEFTAQVVDAYNHLYDLVYLRTHPLTDFITPDTTVTLKKKAWLLHDVLLSVIEELDPGFHAPAEGREKRRYKLLAMRYCDGVASKAVADALAISLRHYYREHDTAMEAVSAILWQRYGRKRAVMHPTSVHDAPPADKVAGLAQSAEVASGESSLNRQAMLRAEAAHFHDLGPMAQLGEVLAGAVELAQEMARVRGIHLTLEVPQAVAVQPVDRILMRQILFGALSYLAEELAEGEIAVRVCVEDQAVTVKMVANGKLQATSLAGAHEEVHHREEQVATLYELARMQSAQLEAVTETVAGMSRQVGFALLLPRLPRRTVLLVDDNNDILELYQRYLQHRFYRSVAVQSGGEALHLASHLQPQAIVLDLMLPEQDGWEILQRLTNHPDTQGIPVVICSILRARQLALSLGAAAFLEKPVDEMELISVLDSLTADRRAA